MCFGYVYRLSPSARMQIQQEQVGVYLDRILYFYVRFLFYIGTYY